MYVVPKRRASASKNDSDGTHAVMRRMPHNHSAPSKPQHLDTAHVDTGSTVFALPTDTHILDGFVDSQDGILMRQLERDMYYHDPICGGCVEIYSMLPFGDFSLSGLPDRDMLNKHLKCTEALRLKTLFPSVTIDQLVDGAVTGALAWNGKEKIFDKYLPLNLDFVDVFVNPFHGEDAVLDIKMNQDVPNFIFKRKDDPRVDRIMKDLPEVLRSFFTGGKLLKLDPENTVFIPRITHLSHYKQPSSLFRRVVPIWLLEKALMRGTIEQGYRRQRGILWIQMGGPDYVASIAEMQQMCNDVVLSDRDPTGAVLVTRPDVNFQEIREGGNLWKHSDIVDVYTPLKLRAMGFPQALIDGDLSVGGADSVMNVFNRTLRGHRDNLVRALCYEKIFPYVSIQNGFEKENELIETSSTVDISDEDYLREISSPNGRRLFRRNGRYTALADGRLRNLSDKDPSRYYIPTVNWHDSFRPEVQSDYLDTFDKLAAHNIPVPMRAYIAAGGMTVGDIVASMDEDFDLRQVMAKQMKKINKLMPQQPPDQQQNFARLIDAAQEVMASAGAERRGIFSRDEEMAEANDEYLRHVNKGPVSRRGRSHIEERANKVLAESAAKLGQRANHEIRKQGAAGRVIARTPK